MALPTVTDQLRGVNPDCRVSRRRVPPNWGTQPDDDAVPVCVAANYPDREAT